MTTLLETPLDDDLTGALDGLAAAAEQARDDARTRAVLAAVVQRLEDATGARLGDAVGDPLVVLQRRFGRAHARLAARPTAGVDVDLLQGFALAVRGPEPHGRSSARAALTGCPVPATC